MAFRFAAYLTRNKIHLIALSAVLMSLSYHPIGLHFLAWFGLIPLLFATEGTKPSLAYKSGMIFGFIFSLLSLFWLVFLQIDTNIKVLMLFGLLLLFLYFGAFYATGFLIASKIGLWFLPLALTGLEFIRGIGELGFPWLLFGYSQARYPLIIQQASIYGVYGLSFWLILINVLLYKLLKLRKPKYFLFFAVAFSLPLLYGRFRMHEPAGAKISVGIIQPNIDPNLKFTKAMREESFNRLIDLSEKCSDASTQTTGRKLDLIIWPETATPIFLMLPGKHKDLVLDLSERTRTCIFTGTPIYDFKNRNIYNGAVLVEPRKGITQEYRKIHLVPFGEHIPFDRHIPAFRKIDVGGGDYAPGNEYTVFETNGLRFACLICFESIFTDISRKFTENGAMFLINITNDGWFGKISGPQQHNDMAILRAVENGVPLIRCANTGISMVVDKYGRILEETELFQKTFICGRLSIEHLGTPYKKLGDLLPILSLLIITFMQILKYNTVRDHQDMISAILTKFRISI